MARPKILVFQHVPYEPLGTLDPLLKEAGSRIRYVNFGHEPASRPSLDGYQALIILGGPMNSDQIESHPNLITELEIIRRLLTGNCRYWGSVWVPNCSQKRSAGLFPGIGQGKLAGTTSN